VTLLHNKKEMEIKEKEAIAGVKNSFGFVTEIAKKLKCSRMTIYRLMDEYPLMKEARDDEKEATKDFAEGKLLHNIKKGKEISLLFFLKTQAKDRGYIERSEITGPDGGPLPIVFEKVTREKKPRKKKGEKNDKG